MSASTGSREANKKPGHLLVYPIGAVQVNKGTMVFVRAADGFAYPARSTNTITDRFVGVAFEQVNNATGTAGAVNVRVEKDGCYDLITSGATNTWMGLPVYASDDQTVTVTSGTTVIAVGYIVQIESSTLVKVRIDNAVQ